MPVDTSTSSWVEAMLKILFIRHGESIGNRDQRMAGETDDGLTPQGRGQCQRLAQYLYRLNWQPSYIYTSPLHRSLESLSYLLQPWAWSLPETLLSNPGMTEGYLTVNQTIYLHNTVPLVVSGQLAEFQAGILSDLTWAEAQRRYPQLCQTLETSREWVAIPNAETPLDGRQRARQFIQRLIVDHTDHASIWIMTHHWILEHLIAALMGCDRTWQIAIPNTALFEFWLDRDRWMQPGLMDSGINVFWQIKRFGDCPHLQEQ